MPHDAFGRELKVGDRVMVPMIVEELHLMTADFCNVKLTSAATMPPDHQQRLTISAINTQQLLRANDGDNLEYRRMRAGLGGDKLIEPQRHFQHVEVAASPDQRTPCQLFDHRHRWDYSIARRRTCRRCQYAEVCVYLPEQRYQSGPLDVHVLARNVWLPAIERTPEEGR